MRIVVDLQACQNGSRFRGIGRYSMSITRAMLKLGTEHEFWIMLTDRFPGTIASVRRELGDLVPQDRIVVCHLPEHVCGSDPECAWRSRAAEALREHFLASLEPDLVFLPSLFEGFWDDCVTSIGRQPIPTAVTAHDLIPLVWPKHCVTAPEERASYNRKLKYMTRADLWLAVSDYSGREASKLLGLPEQWIVNTSEGADPKFRPLDLSTEDAEAMKAKFGITMPFIMFASGAGFNKNLEGLIEAFCSLPANLRRSHQLTLVGLADENHRNHLAALFKRFGVRDDEIVVTGYTTDQELIALYNLCHLFVFPSLHEGFGLPALEAMACGAPVIGSSKTSVPEVIGRPEALFDPYSVAAIAALMQKALTDEAYRQDLRTAGLKQAATFSWDSAARRAVSAFEALHAEKLAAGPQRRIARPRLAFVGALPPATTPGALQAAALLPALCRHYDITLITDQKAVDSAWLTANFAVHPTGWLDANSDRFDRILYTLDGSLVGLGDLAERHPGVILLHDLFLPETRPDLDEPAYLCWLYDSFGWDAALTAAELGRATAASDFPTTLAALGAADGVVCAQESLAEAARPWLGQAVTRWRSLADGTQDPGRAAAELAAMIEAFSEAGPSARKARLVSDISAECKTAPMQEDLVSVVRALSANQRPAGRPQLLVDVSAAMGAPMRSPERRQAMDMIAALVRAGGAGRRIEPVYAEGAHYRYARAFSGQALGLDGLVLGDDAVEIFPGDVYLAVSPPPAAVEAGLAQLQEMGARILFLLSDDANLATQAVGQAIAPLLALAVDLPRLPAGQGGVWISPAGLAEIDQGSGGVAAVSGAAHSAVAIERLLACWAAGIDAAALVLGQAAGVRAALKAEIGNHAQLRERLTAIDHPDHDRLDKKLQAALEELGAKPALDGVDLNYAVRGHVLGTYSLAMVNRFVARALEQTYPGRVKVEPFENGPVRSLEAVPAEERRDLQALVKRALPKKGRTVTITQHYPISAPQEPGDLSLSLFAWEESLVPRPLVQALAKGFDGVLASSKFTAKALHDSGLKIPVVSIGQPAEISAFADLRRAQRRPGEPFTFLHVSSAFPRKGVDVLLAAWARAFKRSDPVRLVLKTFPNPHNDVAARLEDLRRTHGELAPIELIDRDLDVKDLLELYRQAGAIVSPSRGEGYNLPALEAMAAGVPLIVTGFGGHRDFCGPDEARLIRYRMAVSESHVNGANSLWAEPSEDDLVDALREMVDPQQAEAIAARSQRARRRALQVTASGAWAYNLTEVAANLLSAGVSAAPKLAWISTWDVRCGIAEYSRLLLDQFSPESRRQMLVIADERKSAGKAQGLDTVPAWRIGAPSAWVGIAEAVARSQADAVIFQHQQGLVRWLETADLLMDPRMTQRVTVIVLHNAVHLKGVSDEERAAVARGLRHATRVVVHNLADVNLLLSLGVDENVTLLPHGAAKSGRTPPIRDLTDPGSAPVIGSHGFFLPGKGIDRLIRAFASLRPIWPGLTLRLVMARMPGEDSDREIESCRRIARDLGVHDAIEWQTDFLPTEQIHSLLAGCDLIVMAYDERTDSASGAVRVSMASLAPVAATRVGIFAELGDAVGWLDSNEPTVMAKAIEALLKNADQRRQIQAKASQWLDAHDWVVVAERLERMTQGLVEARRFDAIVAAMAVEEDADPDGASETSSTPRLPVAERLPSYSPAK